MKPFLLLSLLAAVAVARSGLDLSDLLRHFDYEQKAPPQIQESTVRNRNGVLVHEISYASPKGGRVSAYLVVPPGKGPFAAIVWGHWYMPNSPTRNKTEFLEEAVVLTRSGVVSLLPDGPIARPGHVDRESDDLTDQDGQELLQQVIDMRRAVDLLLARTDVDPKRIGYVGHSYDATVGAILTGVEPRIRAFVLMAGGLSDEIDRRTPEMKEFRQKMGAEKFDRYTAKWSFLDPGKYVSRPGHGPLFLQYATKEDFLTPAHAREYYKIVAEPKSLKFYDAPHVLNAEARRDRVEFLHRELALGRIDTAAVSAIPQTK